MTVRLTAALSGVLVLALLNGCTLLPERKPQKTFVLPAPDLSPDGQPPTPLTLRVLTPDAESPLDGTHILVNPGGHTVQAYGGARWSKPTPILIRDHWIEGLRQNGGLKAVVSEASDATSDLSLSSDLTRFQLHYHQGQPSVTIQLDAQVLESASRQVVAARRFLVQQVVADKPVESMIAGFGRANQTATEEMVAWLIEVSRELYEETDQARPLSDTESSTKE